MIVLCAAGNHKVAALAWAHGALSCTQSAGGHTEPCKGRLVQSLMESRALVVQRVFMRVSWYSVQAKVT
eukprot:scaffold133498_cov14-Tisochrysis_lutea.AAC.1